MTMTIDKNAWQELMKDAESKKALKSFFKEILLEEPKFFKEILTEILEENQVSGSDEQAERRKKIEAMIDEDFDKYDEVFKALA
ncbi:MAG: hypothetical protein R2825_17675 [Saprospiraceae bacterium]